VGSAGSGPIQLDTEQMAKLRSELDVVQQNCQVFGEMLTEQTPGHEQPDDWALMQVSISVSSVCLGSRSGIKVYTIHKRCWCPVPWYSARHQSKLEGRGLGDSMSHGVPVYLLAYARISFTAWRQRQMCINNLPRVILERKPVGIEPAISNLESNALITACC